MNDKPNNPGPAEFFFISQLVGDKVVQEPKDVLGRLRDLEIKHGGLYPEVVNLIVNRSFGRPPLAVPFSCVKSLDDRKIVIAVPDGLALKEFKGEPERILIKDMILDKRIIDTDEYAVEVVYDIHLLHTEGRLFVVHVDIGKLGMLRRLRMGWLSRLLGGGFKEPRLLPWRYVQSLPSDISLAVNWVRCARYWPNSTTCGSGGFAASTP